MPWQTAGGDLGQALGSTHLGSGKVGYLRVMVPHIQGVGSGGDEARGLSART
ncbi:MAG: hypothetical protein KDI12_17725 [Anaerolineae bacterium]|nr:hypothetical protein [Anaerolineae bacterium]